MSITQYELNLRKNQKNIYVISYEYSIKNRDKYTDYSYVFSPLESYKKCLLLIEDLKQNKKFSYNNKKIYLDDTDNGFYIEKVKIDYSNLDDYDGEFPIFTYNL